MCRFVAYRGPLVPLRALVFGGSHPLVEQARNARELLSGHVNADGWGVVWYHGGQPVRLARPEPIWYAEELERLLEAVESGTALAALRNASEDMPIGLSATSPLTLDRWSFTLNGFVDGFHEGFKRSLHRRLPDDLHARLRNGNDTETLFFLAVDALRRGADLPGALARVVETVEEIAEDVTPAPEAQLNMALADGDFVAVCRASNTALSNSLYVARSPALLPGGVVVASECLDQDPAWSPVDHRSLLLLGPGGEVERRSLPG